MLTYGNLRSNIDGIAETGIAGKQDSTLAILPFHHSYPLMVTLLLPLSLGSTIVFLDELTPEDILGKLQTYKVSILVGVPRLYYMFHRRIKERIEANPIARLMFTLSSLIGSRSIRRILFKKVHSAFGGNIKYMVSGGAKLNPDVAKDLDRLGFTVVEGYGLTETSPIITFNPPDRIKLGSVGVPIKDVYVRLSKEGEILVKGPNVMKGYWNKPKETQEVIKRGWFHTGDLGHIDEDGYLYIVGRKKEIIVLGTGKNVNPEEIENKILNQSPLIREVGVLERGEKLHALIRPDLDKARELGVVNVYETIKWEVIDKVNRELPEWKRIVGFRIISEELPRTRLGKLRRFMLQDIYDRAESERHTEEDTSLLNTSEGKALVSFLRRFTDEPIRPSSHIELELGLDSLGKVELLSFLEESFGVKLEEEELAKYSRVEDLINLISGRSVKSSSTPKSWREILLEAKKVNLSRTKLPIILGSAFLKLLFKLYNRLEVEGLENLPPKPFILAPNHASYLDGFLIAASLPSEVLKDTYFLGEEAYFRNPVASLFGRLAHLIPVDINRNLREALQKSAQVLREGKVLVIFPEGARTRDGNLLEFKKGVAILSKELSIPIVPVGISGAYESLSIRDKFPKPAKIKLVFGKPMLPQEQESYEQLIKRLKRSVEFLLEAER
jgi:long-chain acyl-CoA synthetase